MIASLLVASLAVPDVFGDDAFLFACAYAFVRLAHLTLYAGAPRAAQAMQVLKRRP